MQNIRGDEDTAEAFIRRTFNKVTHGKLYFPALPYFLKMLDYTITDMKVFISYGALADQVTALRLQALAAVNGLTVFVPPAYTRQEDSILLDPEIAQKLNASEVVLGVVGAGLSEACRQELNGGLVQRKHMIVMSYPAYAPQLRPYFASNLVVVDPSNPDKSEHRMVGHLRSIDAQQNAKNALLALGTLTLGLFLFAPADHR